MDAGASVWWAWAEGAGRVSVGGEEPKMSSSELSTGMGASVFWVEVLLVAGDGGAESAELESVCVEAGIACVEP